jgi:hypothetical protein
MKAMQRKSFTVLVLCLAFIMCFTTIALAAGAKLLCVTNQDLKGEQDVSSCLAKGDEFAIVDQYGVVHVLTPREVELTKAFNPQMFQQRAFGMRFRDKAPDLKVFGSVPVPSK